jgi:hypothetical protein
MKSRKSRIIKKFLIIIPCIIIIFLLISFIVNKMLVSKEKKMLKKAGYYNPVSVGDYSLNVYDYGNKDGEHTFVGISGRGVYDYSVKLSLVTDRFAEDNRIVIVDRAGYGLSDDTKTPQTLETVVNNYRTALKNSGIEAPYILLPHSLGGAYATYWVSKYPEEIEGVVFLDGTQLSNNTDLDEGSVIENKLSILADQLGLVRIASPMIIKSLRPGMNYSDTQRDYSKALNLHNTFNNAVSYEELHSNEICSTAFNEIKTNDVPKVQAGVFRQKKKLMKCWSGISANVNLRAENSHLSQKKCMIWLRGKMLVITNCSHIWIKWETVNLCFFPGSTVFMNSVPMISLRS